MKFFSKVSEQEILKKPTVQKVQTGVWSIDHKFGFPPGFYLLLGNSGSGKGWLATWMVRQFWLNNQKKSVFFSLEMSEELVKQRVLQQWSNFTQKQAEELPSLKALELLKTDCLVIDEMNDESWGKTLEERFVRLVDFYYQLGYRMFHFDHLHELDGVQDNERGAVIIARWGSIFQGICKKYNDAWLFIFAQPNGAAAQKNIIKRTDISGTKAITHKCDFFLSINRKKQHEDEFSEVAQETGEIILWLDKSRTTTANKIGFALEFDETGNFTERMTEQTIIQTME